MKKVERLDIIGVFHGELIDATGIDLKDNSVILAGDAFGDQLENVVFDFVAVELNERHLDLFGVEPSQLFFAH